MENQEDIEQIPEETSLTDWENPPSVKDLKQDYTDASGDHDNHTVKVGVWLDNLNITGKAKRDDNTNAKLDCAGWV